MKLTHGIHLAYCTNIHRGETWEETFNSLKNYTLAVREKVCPQQPYAIGLRLSDLAARELSDPETLLGFQRWLDHNGCYIFTINGFPYGRFHGARVKEQTSFPGHAPIEHRIKRIRPERVIIDHVEEHTPSVASVCRRKLMAS